MGETPPLSCPEVRKEMKDLKSLLKNESGNTIIMLVAMAIGILILLVIVTLVSPIGYSIDSSIGVPYGSAIGNTAVANAWNQNQTAFTNGTEMWSQLSPMIGTTALVSVVGVLIAVLLGALAMRRR